MWWGAVVSLYRLYPSPLRRLSGVSCYSGIVDHTFRAPKGVRLRSNTIIDCALHPVNARRRWATIVGTCSTTLNTICIQPCPFLIYRNFVVQLSMTYLQPLMGCAQLGKKRSTYVENSSQIPISITCQTFLHTIGELLKLLPLRDDKLPVDCEGASGS